MRWDSLLRYVSVFKDHHLPFGLSSLLNDFFLNCYKPMPAVFHDSGSTIKLMSDLLSMVSEAKLLTRGPYRKYIAAECWVDRRKYGEISSRICQCSVESSFLQTHHDHWDTIFTDSMVAKADQYYGPLTVGTMLIASLIAAKSIVFTVAQILPG